MFFAFTANLYPVFGKRLEIEHDVAPVDVQVPSAVPLASVADDANAEAVYSVIVSPPFAAGALHVTFAVVVVKVAEGAAGASGAREGTRSAGVGEAVSPSPPAFVASTVKV